MQIVSGVYDPSNVVDDAIQDENRNPDVLYQGAQTLGIQKVVPCPDILEAPASPCNIIHCEPITCKSNAFFPSLDVAARRDWRAPKGSTCEPTTFKLQ
jgi:hypothetical protein